MQNKLHHRRKMDEIPFIQAIRRGLIITIPLLMIGSFALILTVLPIPPYQTFINAFAGGALNTAFSFINRVTFGVLGLAICISISSSYMRQQQMQTTLVLSAVFASVCAFLILNGFFTENFNVSSFGAQGMFTAIFCSVIVSALYLRMVRGEKFTLRFYTVGANVDFNNAISVVVPVGIVVVLAYLFNGAIIHLFGVTGFEDLIHTSVNALFGLVKNNSAKSFLFIMLTNFFWFFGIHGTNVLDNVAQNIFASTPLGETTVVAEFLTKPVIDVFILMGGCGTTLSLLVAILLFSRQRNNRSLAKMAAIPMLFNINELMMFGLPIVFNATFFIPFLLVPLACIGTTWVALTTGLVPPPTFRVEWVTPVFINGFQATGSIAGSLLQVFNIIMGAFIYRWFLLRYERRANEQVLEELSGLSALMEKALNSGTPLKLMDLRGREGGSAKMLAEDLRHVLKKPDSIRMFYQPQYNNLDECVGAEALLRWNHPRYGLIFPPLVIELAQETGLLAQLEKMVFTRVAEDVTAMAAAGGLPGKISVNVTAATLQSDGFEGFLQKLFERHPAARGVLCIELTEQMSFKMGEQEQALLTRIRAMGAEFAVDDFSMGHTSVRYLQSNLFDTVKLDGSLVGDMLDNPRSEEIVSTIVHMSHTMHFKVVAEYVETATERLKLEELGCYLYQGYLFSPAVPLEELIAGHLCKVRGYAPVGVGSTSAYAPPIGPTDEEL